MQKHTFSLPENCSLKLDRVGGVQADVVVMFKDEYLCTLFTVLLGQKVSVRRSLQGVTMVIDDGDGDYVPHYHMSRRIRELAEDRARSRFSKMDVLNHFETLKLDPESLARMKSEFERSFQQTVSRVQSSRVQPSMGYSTRPFLASPITDYASFVHHIPQIRLRDAEGVVLLDAGV